MLGETASDDDTWHAIPCDGIRHENGDDDD